MSILVYVIVLLVLLVMVIASARARVFQLRRIAAYNSVPLTVGEAVESDRTIHVSMGSSAVRDISTISAVASSELLYYFAERAALGDRPPLVTLSDPVTLTLALNTVRRAFKARNVMNKYRTTMVRWYPQGPLSMAYAAGAGAAMLDEEVSTNLLIGRFGPELMLIAESALRYDRFLIAQSDQIDGQAVAYAVSDAPLIGEELYAGGAYLFRSPLYIGGAVTQDVMRYIVIALIIGLVVLASLGTRF